MPASDATARDLLRAIATATISARRSRRWSQRQLASAAGVSQPLISRLEQARMRALPLATAVRVLIALDVAIDLRLVSPFAAERPQRDRAHVRCVAYVARRLTRSGYDVATEAQLGNGRWLGFADLLAFDPDTRLLLLIEVKTVIDDVGAIQFG